MTDTNRTNAVSRDAGFTLFELVVVLFMATVLSTVAVTGSLTAWNGYRLRSSAQELATKVNEARTNALKRSRTVWVLLNTADNSMQVQTNGAAGVVNIGGRAFLARNIRYTGFVGTRVLPFDLMGRPGLATNVIMTVGGGAVQRQVIINAAGRVTVQ